MPDDIPVHEARMSPEVRELVAQMLFKQEEGPAALYVGLSRKDVVHGELPTNYQEVEDKEPIGAPGYERFKLESGDWTIKTDVGGIVHVETQAPTFINRSEGEDVWPMVDAVFVTTRPEGEGVLVGWTPLRFPHALTPESILRIPLAFLY